MGVLDSAIAKMAGEDKQGSKNMTNIDVINAAIELLQYYDAGEVADKLDKLRSAISDGDTSLDTLLKITGYLKSSDEVENIITLNNAQKLRFELRYPIAYKEFQRGCNLVFTNRVVKEIVKTYPKVPVSNLIYKDIKGARTAYCDRINKTWSWDGENKGHKYAWAYDYDLYILDFYDNIFNVGVIMCCDTLDEMVRCYHSCETTTAIHSDMSGTTKVEFKFGTNFDIYVAGEKIMSIDSYVMSKIVNTVEASVRVSLEDRRYHTEELILATD